MSSIIVPPPPDAYDFELEIQRKNTKYFLDADPAPLVLFRSVRVRTDAGGYKDGPFAGIGGPPQIFRLIPANDRMPEIKAPNGRLVTPVYTLLGEHDADVRRWDRFEFNTVWYEIASPIRPEHTDSRYETKGDLVRREDT